MSGFKAGEWHTLTDGVTVRVAKGPGSFVIATIQPYDGEDAHAVAAGIVRDHNAAPDLAAACKKMVAALRAPDWADTPEDDVRCKKALEEIEAALAKAGL